MPGKNRRKRRQSKTFPNINTIKKQKQSDIESQSEQSESDYFLDAEDQVPNLLEDSLLSESPDTSEHTFSKTTMDTSQCIDDTQPPTQSLSQSQLSQSQSIIPGPEIGITGIPQLTQLPCGPTLIQTSTPVSYHPGLQMPQYSQPVNPQFSSSDNDVMRVAIQCKLLISAEVEQLVIKRVESATAEFKNKIKSLEDENNMLKCNLHEMENRIMTKIDDAEQYSRRSCLRIAGIQESINENTDEIVLNLAGRLNIDLNPRDIDRSHRVGPVQPSSSGSEEPTRRRPREIIVKFVNSQARLSLLKGRKTLRENKEKIFINEDLAPMRKSLAYECRQLRRENKVLKTWVYGGNVFVIDRDNKRVKITQINELDKYKALAVAKEPRQRRGG